MATVLIVVVAGGCAAGSLSTGSAPAGSSTVSSTLSSTADELGDGADAAAAVAICTALKDQANVMAGVANEAVRTINSISPEERVGAIIGGFDAAEAAVGAFLEEIVVLDVPDIAEREAILLEIAVGAVAALDELADERARFSEEAGAAISDADVQGRVGQFFNSIEKVNSLVEPVVARYERVELQRAFLDAEPCEHVIQQFRIDDE